jgi:hypothetical protein
MSIILMRFKFYSLDYPEEKSLVNFIFTEHCKDCFKCYLPDYDIDAIMPFQLATLKTNVKKNINTLAPLNKPFIGSIEEVIDGTIIISMAYIDKDSKDYKDFEDETMKNKILLIHIKKYATKNNLNYITLWENAIYPIDKKRNQSSLFDYIINNMDEVISSGHLDIKLLESLKEITFKTTNTITNFKMVSNNGIITIQDTIMKALEETNLTDLIDIFVDSTPNYYITNKKDQDTDPEQHLMFLKALEKLGKNPESSVFINY